MINPNGTTGAERVVGTSLVKSLCKKYTHNIDYTTILSKPSYQEIENETGPVEGPAKSQRLATVRDPANEISESIIKEII